MPKLKLLPDGSKLKLCNLCCFAPEKKKQGGEDQQQQVVQRVEQKQKPESREKQKKKTKSKDAADTTIKTAVAAKKPSIVLLSRLNNGTEDGEGVGIIVRKDLILTSHGTIPSINSAKEGEMALSYPAMGCCPTQTTLKQKLLPSKFFITNPALDITAVACDDVSPIVPLNIEISEGRGPLGIDAKVYILGAPQASRPSISRNLKVGEARVTMEGDSIVKSSTDGEAWSSGSAGFTKHGDFAFMVCQPRRFSRAASLESSNSAASTSSQKRSCIKQSGVALREISRWLENGMPSAAQEPHRCRHHHAHGSTSIDRDRSRDLDRDLHKHLHHSPKSPPPPDEARLSFSPCYHHIESPRSCASSGLNPRQPLGISYTATPSTKSSPTPGCSPRRRSPNPRKPGVSHSTSPTRSVTSAKSRRSSQRSSGRSSPCYRTSPPCCLSSGNRSPIRLSSCCLGRCDGIEGDRRREFDQKFQDFLDSPEFEPPPCPLSGSSSSEEEPSATVVYSSRRGRPRSVAATKKQIFKGPTNKPVRAKTGADECGASDGELNLITQCGTTSTETETNPVMYKNNSISSQPITTTTP